MIKPAIKITKIKTPFALKNSQGLSSYDVMMATFKKIPEFQITESGSLKQIHKFNVLSIEREDGSGDRFNLRGYSSTSNGRVTVLVDFKTNKGEFTIQMP